MSRTTARGRVLARFLATAGGFRHVEVSEHYPDGYETASSQPQFELSTPFGPIRVVPRNRIYPQEKWLRYRRNSVVMESPKSTVVDEVLVAMTASTFAVLTSAWVEAHPAALQEWLRRQEKT